MGSKFLDREFTQYENDDYESRDCRVIERNGSLVYVEDEETLEREWVDYRRVR